jgi:thioesterase domain-containing protein/aryl carrier-like protein
MQTDSIIQPGSFESQPQLGYVVFTSGTTGEPKGVEFSGEALRRKLESFVADERGSTKEVGRSQENRYKTTLLGYPFNFGAGIRRLSWVVRGSHIYILSKEELKPQRFLELTESLAAQIVNVPASLLIVLSEYQASSRDGTLLQSVEMVSWGGDSVSFGTINRLRKFFSEDTLFRSGFGATEGSAKLSYEFLLREAPESGEIPIGQASSVPSHRRLPIDGSKNQFTLRFEEPLASGYYSNPQLTEARFKVDEAGVRYWISGDIIEEDQAGQLWHRGRIDDLVKIRGKLSSPSEATKKLLNVAGVVDALVVPREIGKHIRLVAHIVLSKENPPKLSYIKESLYKTLPSHLIPSQYFVHESLPKNSRGKTDRSMLSKVDFAPWEERTGFPPMTKTEVTLHTHLQDLMGTSEISIDDNLWHQGLDSLAALELATLLETDFPNVNVDTITQHATMRTLAKALDRLEGNFSDIVTLNAGSKAEPIYAFPGGGNRSTHFVHFARALNPPRPVVCLLSAAGDLSIENTTIHGRTNKALDSLKATNVRKISIVGYSAGGALAYEFSRLCAHNGISVTLSLFDTGFSIMQGKRKLTVDRFRLSQDHQSRKLRGITKAWYLVLKAFRRHGFRRALGLLFFSKPLEFLTINPSLREILRRLDKSFLIRVSFGIRAKLSEAITRHELAEYDAKPLTELEQKLVEAKFFYTETSDNYLAWKRLIPTISFLPTGGNHFNMLHPPHVLELVKRDF